MKSSKEITNQEIRINKWFYFETLDLFFIFEIAFSRPLRLSKVIMGAALADCI
jgi:hypothetical protein